ncbi:hypothetical protein Tco_0554321 [Tanacetum coccineum]
MDFKEEKTGERSNRIVKGKEVVDDDLKKPFKEAVRTPLTRRIIEFVGPEYKMPTNIKIYDGTNDLEDHLSCFANAANSGEWLMPVWCRMFQQTLNGSARIFRPKACFKEPHEITRIVRKANESLTAFKERWTIETSFIMGVPEVMKIASFMDSLKCPELSKRFSNKVPITVEEIMTRVDDFIRYEETFVATELPKGETGEHHRKSFPPTIRRDDRPYRNNHRMEARRSHNRVNPHGRDSYGSYRGRDYCAPYPPPRGYYQAGIAPVLTLAALTKPPKEILATETQLRLPPPRPMVNPQRGVNSD